MKAISGQSGDVIDQLRGYTQRVAKQLSMYGVSAGSESDALIMKITAILAQRDDEIARLTEENEQLRDALRQHIEANDKKDR